MVEYSDKKPVDMPVVPATIAIELQKYWYNSPKDIPT
jgi:hypothetical protein